MVRLAGSLYNDAGAALASASVAVFPTSVSASESTGTGSATATTTTNSSGVWSSTGLAANSYDVRITSGSSIRWRRFADEIQLTRASFGDDAGIDLGTCSDIVMFNRSTTLSADAEVAGITEGTSDHLGVAANSLIVSNLTNDGDIMFIVSDNGDSKGLLKLCGANSRAIVHGGDLLLSGAQKLYFNDVGGEYISGDASTLTITGNTTVACALTVTGATTLNGNVTLGNAACDVITINGTVAGANAILFEGATADGNEITLAAVDPTADHTVYLPNQGGYLGVFAAASTTQISSTPAELNLLDALDRGSILYGNASCVTAVLGQGSCGTVLTSDGTDISWQAIGTVSVATSITASANNCANETVYPTFVDGATGTQGIETDTGLTYNPNTGLLTATGFSGNLTGTLQTAAQTNITSVGALCGGSIGTSFGTINNGSSTITTTGLISGGSLDIDNVLINGTTIGHTCDTDLMTVGNACLTLKGAVTVGVDDTGHDVKFFGASAGAYMLYDESLDTLEIRGPSADATTSDGKLLLTTALTDINANDVIGSINFQAPVEAGGTDAITVAAGIRAVAQATFTCAVNNTDLIFYAGKSEAATEKFRFTADGEIGIGGTNYGSDGQVLTSGGPCAAAAWEDASGGGGGASAVQVNDNVAFAAGTGSDSKIYYDGTDSHWDLRDTGTGALVIALGACHPSPDGNAVHIWEGTAGSVTARTAAMLVLESCTTDEVALQFLMPGGGTSQQAIFFGDAADVTAGGIIYDHPDNEMRFRTGGSDRMKIESGGVLSMEGLNIEKINRIGIDVCAGPRSQADFSHSLASEMRMYVENKRTCGAHPAVVCISVASGNAGDTYISFDANAAVGWTVGMDNSESDRFLIGQAYPGYDDILRISTSDTITYKGSHPTGTYDYVCNKCGKHSDQMFDCCGLVEWHDDVLAIRKAMLNVDKELDPYNPLLSLDVKHMSNLGVFDLDLREDCMPFMQDSGRPWFGINLQTAQWFTWAGMWQNRERMDAQYIELKEELEAVKLLVKGGNDGSNI